MLGICLELRLADWTLGAMPVLPGRLPKCFFFGQLEIHRWWTWRYAKERWEVTDYQTCQDCFVSSQQGSHVGKAGCCAESYQKVVACQAKSGLESQYEVMSNKLGTSTNFLSNVASGGCMTTALSFPTIHKCTSLLMSWMPIAECGTQQATPAVTTFA